ncbi:IS110 family transposase [Blastococcus sp. MG754426]|uniref:IS110 family transposase n=1 Tax=unclassified Blastococcus TaxID=2619396 RepID=UPI001EF11EC0|nr:MULTISPECIES: IS110 family transposase [unclassified Blastococcus]MCF6510140.1 IS110 family transposase [Blastococcus sp. MG754426]MCF6514505.1 IS110 family transposase [Blastococcus sp. MG754427]MCF6737715.1 IS110 family transposase [Blastococcus sp. KM273129]
MSMLAELVEVVIGVDTHSQTHTAAVLDARTGAVLARATVPADPDGYAELIAVAEAHSGLRAWAMEGTGGYGAGLARHLAATGELVVELDRPKRPLRRAGAKSDPIDAERAARDALARTQLAQPKTGAERAALQMRLTARRAAVEAAGATTRQLLAMVITSPEPVRSRFRGQTTRAVITTAAALRPAASSGDIEAITALTVLRQLARRIRFLEAEALDHEKAIRTTVRSWRPDLLELTGVGPIVAATVLTAWSHPGRCRDDAAFAMLAGTAPIPASSGKTVRHRLNRSGDRQLNRALHTVTLTRMHHDERTRTYADRRRAEGKTDREIKRCLKRYIARELYRRLETPPSALDAS